MRSTLEEICDKYSVTILPKGTYISKNANVNASNLQALMNASSSSSGSNKPAEPLLLGYSGMITKEQTAQKELLNVAAIRNDAIHLGNAQGNMINCFFLFESNDVCKYNSIT